MTLENNLYILYYNICFLYAEFFDTGRKEKVILPTAPRATRSPDIDDEKVPKVPPFSAYISNLPYDIEESDLSNFFRNLEVQLLKFPYFL